MTHQKIDNSQNIPSGFRELDELTSGFHKSELIVIASYPGMGKTALALAVMVNIAVKDRIPLGVFSLEMSTEAILQHILEIEAKASFSSLSVTEFHRFNDVAGNVYDAPLYLDDTPSMKIPDLIARIRSMREEHHIEIVLIDYLNLIRPESQQGSRSEEVTETTCRLKDLACELEMPVMLLVQVCRNAEKRMPGFEDLQHIGDLKQHTDLAIFVRRRDADKTSNAWESDVDLAIESPRADSRREITIQLH